VWLRPGAVISLQAVLGDAVIRKKIVVLRATFSHTNASIRAVLPQ